jgi:hypothetical protein
MNRGKGVFENSDYKYFISYCSLWVFFSFLFLYLYFCLYLTAVCELIV